MVQILPQRPAIQQPSKRSKVAEFSEAARIGLTPFLEKIIKEKDEKKQQKLINESREKENEAVKKLTGFDFSGIENEETRSKLTQQAFKSAGRKKFVDELNLGKYGIGKEELSGINETPNIQEQQQFQGMEEGQQRSPRGEMKVKVRSLIPRETILAAEAEDPQLANLLQKFNENQTDEARHQEKQFTEAQERSPETQRQKHLIKAEAEADSKYVTDLNNSLKSNIQKTRSLENLKKLNEKNVTGKAFEKGLEKTGFINFTSEGRREFAAEVKNLISDIKTILGGQFSNFEFQTILNAYPSADFSKEANRAIINNLEVFQDIKNKEYEIAQQLIDQNGGDITPKIQFSVNKKVQEYTNSRADEIKRNTQKIINEQHNIPKGHTFLIDPNGEEISVPNDKVDELLEFGAQYP
jgi:hypothetical protein